MSKKDISEDELLLTPNLTWISDTVGSFFISVQWPFATCISKHVASNWISFPNDRTARIHPNAKMPIVSQSAACENIWAIACVVDILSHSHSSLMTQLSEWFWLVGRGKLLSAVFGSTVQAYASSDIETKTVPKLTCALRKPMLELNVLYLNIYCNYIHIILYLIYYN